MTLINIIKKSTIASAAALCLSLSSLGAAPVYAADAPIYTPWHSNLAVGGYDVVSFYNGKPVKGTSAYFFGYKGATWQFASQESRNQFISDPSAYEPQYGGYCAWALAHDKLAKGDPQHWSLVDDKLYLNFNARIKSQWEMNRAAFIVSADAIWPQILE